MSILITGGSGYLGWNLANSLGKVNQIVIYDLQAPPNLSNQESNISFISGSITDSLGLNKLFSNNAFDTVYHLAALKNVNESFNLKSKYLDVNLDGTKKLFELSVKYGIKHFLFASSAAVYGNLSSSKIFEIDKCIPISPYGESKLEAENYLLNSNQTLNVSILRLFNLAGFSSSGQADETASNIFPILARSFRDGETVRVFGSNLNTKDGSCIRDYVHVSDVSNALVELVRVPTRGFSTEVFNLSRNIGVSVLEVIEEFKNQTGIKPKIAFEPLSVGNPIMSVGDNTKLIERTNWAPQLDLKEMVASTLQMYF
jgi:UDP-glucose 4-epimerase